MDELKSATALLDSIEKRMAEMPGKEEMKALSDEQARLSRQILDLQQKGLKVNVADSAQKSIGDQILSHDAFKAMAEGATPKCRIEIPEMTGAKTEEDPTMLSPAGGVIPAYRRTGVLPGAFRPFTIEQLIPTTPIATNAFEYVQEKSFDNKAAFVAESAQKPFSKVEFELKTGTIRTIAHMARVSKQLLADAPALVSYINTRLVYGLDLVVEDQIIKGDGTGQNLKGLFTEGNYTAHSATLAAVGGANATLFDLVLHAKTKVESAFFRPNLILLNPENWASMQMAKNSGGDYYLGHPAAVAPMVLWGVRVVASPAVAKGNFMVMDTAQAATLWARQGITVEVFEQDADNVQKNLVTIRAERRLGLSVERPQALVGGGLVIPSAPKA